ncbi:inhibin beta C chain-like [Ambystoma mexicanum]|uniref:inhibin beta C chain-like n=1 Tax=Ambystoma mexicanum TaxID=8296 RepID=UPI0037E9509A
MCVSLSSISLDYADSYGVCLYFRFSADEERSVEFLNATLWLFVLNSRKRRRLVTITSSLCRRDNVDCTFVAQMQLDVWRSRWFNVTLEPPNLSQDGKRLRIELRCEGCHGASRLASTSGFDRPFMVVEARHGAPHVPHRRSLTCTSSSDTCCRNSFYVSFKEIGWNNWIIWPEGYYMNYCKGECPLNLAGIPGLAASFHTAVYNLIKAHNVPSSVGSCCVATKLQPLSILYFDNSTNIVKKDIQNMIVERCGCT